MTREAVHESPEFLLLTVALALAVSACNAGDDTNDEVICNRVTAYRVEASDCSVRDETGLRECGVGEAVHWGVYDTCATSPNGQLYVLRLSQGTDVVNDNGWTIPGIDAGLSDECMLAIQNVGGCQF
jgi:hypothetical protein